MTPMNHVFFVEIIEKTQCCHVYIMLMTSWQQLQRGNVQI